MKNKTIKEDWEKEFKRIVLFWGKGKVDTLIEQTIWFS